MRFRQRDLKVYWMPHTEPHDTWEFYVCRLQSLSINLMSFVKLTCLQFLLIVMGVKNTTSKHPCIWCTIDKGNLINCNNCYSMQILNYKYDMTIVSHHGLMLTLEVMENSAALIDLELDHTSYAEGYGYAHSRSYGYGIDICDPAYFTAGSKDFKLKLPAFAHIRPLRTGCRIKYCLPLKLFLA